MQPLLTDRIIDIDRMDETTVVPQQQIADTPLMVVLIFGSRYALVDLVQQVIAFLGRAALGLGERHGVGADSRSEVHNRRAPAP